MAKVLILGEHKEGKLKLTAAELSNVALKDGCEIIGMVMSDNPDSKSAMLPVTIEFPIKLVIFVWVPSPILLNPTLTLLFSSDLSGLTNQ